MKSAKKNKVGFIGLGIMGKPMVINLIKNDIEVYFYARKKRIIDEISKIGGKFIPNPSDISKFTKIILTNLPNTKDVENIIIGENGIINNLQIGSIVIDMSTISPEGTRYINDKLREENPISWMLLYQVVRLVRNLGNYQLWLVEINQLISKSNLFYRS